MGYREHTMKTNYDISDYIFLVWNYIMMMAVNTIACMYKWDLDLRDGAWNFKVWRSID